jgi:uncharacterized linocin/CFP29 family protein
MGAGPHSTQQHGRDKIDWPPEVWHRIDAAVREEITRSRVAAKFLPVVHVPPKSTTVPADIVYNPLNLPPGAVPPGISGALYVDETLTNKVNEVWVELALTSAQVEEEAAALHAAHHQQNSQHNQHQHAHASTGISLFTRGANVLAQVEDSIIFQGQSAFQSELIGDKTTTIVGTRFPGTDLGLLNLLLPGETAPSLLGQLNASQIIPVSPVKPNGAYQERTVEAVAKAVGRLGDHGHYGPYVCVLHTVPFADAHSPLQSTLITPAEPIRHLMNAGFYGTGTLPPFTPAPNSTIGNGLSGGFPTGAISDGMLVVTAGGSGYDNTTTLAFTGGGSTPTAPGTMVSVSSSPLGDVTGVKVTTPGLGYTSVPQVRVVGTGNGAQVAVQQVLYTGFVISLGGNTMDLVRGKMNSDDDVVVRFEQKDTTGWYRFRVVQRFALRLKDITAVVQLQFMSV